MDPRTSTRTVAGMVALACAAVSALAGAGPALAQSVGQPYAASTTVQARVVSATPVVAQVQLPHQVCYDEMRRQAPSSSGAGALLGAIAGGAVGNALGKGSGRALATGVGIFGGALLGNHIEVDGRPDRSTPVRRCEQQVSYQNQVVGYDVVYEYGGQRYRTQMPQQPGRTIAVQLTLSPAVTPAPPVMAPPVFYQDQQYQPTVMVSPPPRVITRTRYESQARGWSRRDWDDDDHRWHDDD